MRTRADRAPILNRDREAAAPAALPAAQAVLKIENKSVAWHAMATLKHAVRILGNPTARACDHDCRVRPEVEEPQHARVTPIHRLASVPIMF